MYKVVLDAISAQTWHGPEQIAAIKLQVKSPQ